MIRILEKQIADKIAAGEVVDRPLSVVKELVENAIDAVGRIITVEIKNGGKTYIRITDNGCGIPAEQAELAFQRHATSKISSEADLSAIETLGFRGEALASIAAVSRIEVITKTPSEKNGTKLTVEGSQTVEKTPTGCPDGTTVIVSDLFYNTPARLKFMKSDAAESSAIIEFVSQIALAYADTKIRMINNGSMLFSTQGAGDRYQNILSVYSSKPGEGLIPVNAQRDSLCLEGYVSGYGTGKVNRKRQIFFVNGRVINSKLLERAVSEVYKNKLSEGRHPVSYLFINTKPDRIDVNIHPNKREIRFHDESFVKDFLVQSIKEALLSKEAIPQIDYTPPVSPIDSLKHPGKAFNNEKSQQKDTQVDVKTLLSTIRKSEDFQPSDIKEEKQPYRSETMMSEISDGARTSNSVSAKPFDFEELLLKGAIFDTYIMATDDSGFYLIDQHAAHERIFFEQLTDLYKSEKKASQPVLTPLTLQVTFSLKANQLSWLEQLEKMGFLLEEFGPKTFIVKEIPMFMTLEEANCFLQDYVDQVSDDVQLENYPVIEKIMSHSCRDAVKAHDHLADEEIKTLMDKLKHCNDPFSCPHGRPTFIKLTKHQLEKMFRRV